MITSNAAFAFLSAAGTAVARRGLLALAMAAVLLVGAAAAGTAHARESAPALPEVALADLPPQAREVHALILRGGPFAYERDGVTFGNRERLLPAKPRGFYHEYTVRTPGTKSRGARRIVCGGPKTAPEVCYWTADHYASFSRIRE
jgi:ribonuclease T1